MNTADYARQYLLRPIGIVDDKWVRGFPDLLPHTGGGLYITTRDLSGIGYLVLRDGRWGDARIVSSDWIAESTRPVVAAPRTFNGRPTEEDTEDTEICIQGSHSTSRVLWQRPGEASSRDLRVPPRPNAQLSNADVGQVGELPGSLHARHLPRDRHELGLRRGHGRRFLTALEPPIDPIADPGEIRLHHRGHVQRF
jgi:hypothetical protein